MMMRILAALAVVLFLVAPASAQLSIAPSGGANIFIVDGENGKEAHRVGDLFTKFEFQFPASEAEVGYLGVLGFYDGDDFGGFGLRYYRRVQEGIYPMFGANVTIMDEGRELIDELTVAIGGEIGLELWVPGPDGTSFPLLVSVGYRSDVVGSDVTFLPIEFSVPLTLFGDS